MLWILLILTPTIVWIIYDSHYQRRHRKNVGKHSNGSGDWFLADSGAFFYTGDSSHGSHHDCDSGGFDGGNCDGGD